MISTNYTAEFTQQGWAVFYSKNGKIQIVTEPRPGDVGRSIAIDTAIILNDPDGA